MTLMSFFSSAIGGGAFGAVLHAATSWFDLWRKGKEQELKLKEMAAMADLADRSEAWKAFTASQNSAGPALVIPANASPWVVNMYLLVDAFSRSTRPGLTWLGAIYILVVFLTSPVAVRAGLAPEINFGAWTMLYWWFGARYQKK